uniref:DUF6519 domain-containing protein n=1 Tax=Marinobacterium profundum TaxID=1714300 RepID=UPI00083301AF|nr:DUF6519 domain-containing protein [Marinobacterium profundum]
MKTQLSRISFDATKRYNGVFQQMGRMLTDADWNELNLIDGERVRQALLHSVLTGTPKGSGIIRRDASDSIGLYYGEAVVEGISARLLPAVINDAPADGSIDDIQNQADFPACPLPPGDYRLYLDVWQRTVTALEDIGLIDPALNGADTCTRRQVMCQLKWCSTDTDPQDPLINPKTGNARLSLELREGSTEPDPCDPCAEELALQEKIGNYLFRVEVHQVEYDASGQPSRVLLKWSSENGAEQHSLSSLPPGFASASWCYEFFSGADTGFASEKHPGRHLAVGFTPTYGELVPGFPAAGSEPANLPLVRRWDGFAAFDRVAGEWLLDSGFDRNVELSTALGANSPGRVTNGDTVLLVLDAITLTLALEDNALLAGDYWQVAVRESVHALDPQLLDAALPQGIEHHYMTIGSVVNDELSLYEGEQCRRFEFPPLTDIRAEDVCFDNGVCDMPDVDTVQEALDHLCQQRDLKWHNKHLHGWGIVCGLIAECCQNHSDETDSSDGSAGDRRSVCVTPGYALSCEGEDLVLKGPQEVPILDMIEVLEQAQDKTLLVDGEGTFCLRIVKGDPEPQFVLEPWSKDKKYAWLDGTLLLDFYQHCVKDLIEALSEEVRFQDDEGLEEIEANTGVLVSDQRRKTISVGNLLAWFFFGNHGHFVWTSLREHQILLAFYNRLRELLRSRTFCAMFQDEEFPPYPFEENQIDTIFSRGDHTRVLMHPDQKQLYSFGGTDSSIHRFDLASNKLVEVLKMPAAQGAEITALCFSNDGSKLYACAAVRGTDTLFGAARIGQTHEWQQSSVLCDILVTEMVMAIREKDQIYAIGKNKGLYRIEPDVIAADTKPQLTPFYNFAATGQLLLDPESQIAWCGSSDANSSDGFYRNIVQCDLRADGENLNPQITTPLRNVQGQSLLGSGNLAMSQAGARDGNGERDTRLYCITQVSTSTTKRISAYQLPLNADGLQEIGGTGFGNSDLWLRWHAPSERLLVAVENECRLHPLDRDAGQTESSRIPVQVGPVDMAASAATDSIYTLNFVSKTVTVTPVAELAPTPEFNKTLENYRYEILLAFWGLISNVLQYLKDCFCHHLLVKCPSCDDDSKLWLATVEVRDGLVYKVCNFDKRKTVKSFPTVEYWASLIPILPLLKKGIAKICCAVLPDLFGPLRAMLLPTPNKDDQRDKKPLTEASAIKQNQRSYNRTDMSVLWEQQKASLSFYGKTFMDAGIQQARGAQTTEPGISKQSYIGSNTTTTTTEFEKRGIEVTAIESYDERYSAKYANAFAGTPQVIERGSKVTLIEKDGIVQFYHIEKAPLEIRLPTAELEALEARKAALELDKTSQDLQTLETRKSQTKAEISALEQQLEQARTERDKQQTLLAQMAEQNRELTTGVSALRSDLEEIKAMRTEINRDIARDRPVKSITEVSPEVDSMLRQLDIRTVEELSKVTTAKLIQAGIDEATAKKINTAAKAKLREV